MFKFDTIEDIQYVVTHGMKFKDVAESLPFPDEILQRGNAKITIYTVSNGFYSLIKRPGVGNFNVVSASTRVELQEAIDEALETTGSVFKEILPN